MNRTVRNRVTRAALLFAAAASLVLTGCTSNGSASSEDDTYPVTRSTVKPPVHSAQPTPCANVDDWCPAQGDVKVGVFTLSLQPRDGLNWLSRGKAAAGSYVLAFRGQHSWALVHESYQEGPAAARFTVEEAIARRTADIATRHDEVTQTESIRVIDDLGAIDYSLANLTRPGDHIVAWNWKHGPLVGVTAYVIRPAADGNVGGAEGRVLMVESYVDTGYDRTLAYANLGYRILASIQAQ